MINSLVNTTNDIKVKNESLNQIKLWNQVLTQDSLNTYNPNNEALTPTFELSGGVVIDNSKTVSTSTTTSLELTHFITASAGISAVVKMGGSGIEGGFEFTTTQTFGQSVANSTNSSTTIAYHLYDDDNGDVFPLKIVRDPAYGTPIFLVGQEAESSCPYEVHSPTANTNYFVSCQSGIYNYERIPAKTILVASPATNLNLTTNYSNGKTFQVATQAVTANNKVIAPAGAVYRAGSAVTLNTGFEARSGTVFRAEIGGCN